jgi:hypothetical protein
MYDAYLKVTPRPLPPQKYYDKLLKNLLEPPCPPPPRCDRSPRRNAYFKHGNKGDKSFEIDKRVLRGLAGLPQEENIVKKGCKGPDCVISGGRKHTRRRKMRRSRRKTRHSRR